MPRRLPWDTTHAAASNIQPSNTNAPPTRRRAVPRPSVFDRNHVRTPSTSPPPQTPTQTPMKASDSAWAMVEDEFYATAQLFTHQLHHAEYKRLKSVLAARKKDGSLGAIARPTRGERPNLEQDLAKAQSKKRSKVRDMVGCITEARSRGKPNDNDDNTESEAEANLIPDRNLASLMHGARVIGGDKGKHNLTALMGKAKSTSRAAAGFGQHGSRPSSRDEGSNFDAKAFPRARAQSHVPDSTLAENEDDGDEDDLDAPIWSAQRKQLQSSQASKTSLRQLSRSGDENPKSASYLTDRKPEFSRSDSHEKPARSRQLIVSKFDDPLESGFQSSFVSRRMAANEKARKGQREGKAIELDEIPTFLY